MGDRGYHASVRDLRILGEAVVVVVVTWVLLGWRPGIAIAVSCRSWRRSRSCSRPVRSA